MLHVIHRMVIFLLLTLCRIFFTIFGGVGFVSLPTDLIMYYMHQPQQQIKEEDFNKRKIMLLNYTMKLREMGKLLENERPHVNQIKGFSGWRKRRQFNRKIRIFEIKSLLAEKEYTILEKETDYFKKVEPLTYTFKLVLGIICTLLSLNWLATM